MDKINYIKSMYSILVPLCEKYGYYNVASGMIAQSIQEGWNSLLATKYFNYWGMKASKDYKGNTIFMDNKQKTDPATYRVFTSMLDGCEGYFTFLKYPRYKSLKQCIAFLLYTIYLSNISAVKSHARSLESGSIMQTQAHSTA